ncbi:MAG: CDP-alcohol phosphatidyltransferase family protein [Candidatus Nanopelagicales bacterium]
MDGTSQDGFREIVNRLAAAQKTNRGAPAYSRWVNRWLGRRIAAAAFLRGATPNQVTAVSAALTYTGIALIAFVAPSIALSLIICVLLLAGYAFDSADGQLARLRGGGRPSGEWLDHVVDMAKMTLLHGAVLFSWLRFGIPGQDPNDWLLGLPILFTAASVTGFFGWLLSDLLVRISRGDRPKTVPAGEKAPWLRSILRAPTDYGILALSFALFAGTWFLPIYALLLAANLAVTLLALPVWFRQVDAVGRPVQ